MRSELLDIFTDKQMDEVDRVIARYRGRNGSLLLVLEQVQEVCRYLPVELQRYVAGKTGISASTVSGVVSFYSYFSMAPKGKRIIKVCTGTACYVKRSENILQRLKHCLNIQEGEVTPDGEYSIEEARCLGACGLAPVVMVGDRTSGLVHPEKAEEVLRKK